VAVVEHGTFFISCRFESTGMAATGGPLAYLCRQFIRNLHEN
jgi:hypothetical protein